MGTPKERDEESDAVDDHLRERGGISIPCSPRALVCGKYQGTGFSFHFRRRCDEGTYLQFDLAQDNMDLISVVLDMTYPYGLTKDKEKPYEGILRQTLVSHENSCHTWIGFGYTQIRSMLLERVLTTSIAQNTRFLLVSAMAITPRIVPKMCLVNGTGALEDLPVARKSGCFS